MCHGRAINRGQRDRRTAGSWNALWRWFYPLDKSRAMREQKSAKCLQSGHTAGNKTNICGVPRVGVGLIFPFFALDSSCNSTQGFDPMRALSLQPHIIGTQPLSSSPLSHECGYRLCESAFSVLRYVYHDVHILVCLLGRWEDGDSLFQFDGAVTPQPHRLYNQLTRPKKPQNDYCVARWNGEYIYLAC